MLNVSEETKIAFLKDSRPKELRIEGQYGKIEDINFYFGTIVGAKEQSSSLDMGITGSHIISLSETSRVWEVTNNNGRTYRDYVCLSFYLKFTNLEITPQTVGINAPYFTNETQSSWNNNEQSLTISEYLDWKRVSFIVPTTDFYGFTQLNLFSNNGAIKGSFTIKQIQFEYGNDNSLLPRDYTPNQVDNKFNFDLADMFPLINENLEMESFSLTESLCSQDNIKFGLCESAHCEFTIVGKNKNYANQIIKPSISVSREITDEDISKINFVYDQSRVYHAGDIWNETRHINSTWYMPTNQWLIYTDISSYDNYFEDKVYTQLEFKINSSTFDVQPKYIMLALYVECENRSSVFIRSNNLVDFDEFSNYKKLSFEFDYDTEWGKVIQVTRPYFLFYDENGNTVNVTADINYSLKNIQVLARLINNQYPAYDVNNCMVENGTLEKYLRSLTGTIPLGTFRIKDIKTENTWNIIKKHITAYDDLLMLEQNGADWYTRYMFGVDTKEYTDRYGFEYARQIYSAFWNYSVAVGLDKRTNYNETLVQHWNWNDDVLRDKLINKHIEWETESVMNGYQYVKIHVDNIDPNKRYVVDFTNALGASDEEVLSDYKRLYDYENYDSLLRGICENGSVLININDSPMYCINRGDYFMIPDDITSFDIILPYAEKENVYGTRSRMLDDIYLYRIDEPIKLTNGANRLLYYTYFAPHNIFSCDSSITGRDIVRSLLEVCGCFFRLSREKGLPEFVYCTQYGLYPSENLYPANDLFPRETVDGELLPMSRYISLISEEYRVHNYGRIQILKNSRSNDTKSVVEWEYIGDDKSDNTYIIDDNIFYCNDAMTYDYDSMSEVSEMLENMFTAINNMGYNPNQVQAIGMPWVECGDRIGLLTLTGGVDSFIFRRTLKGIQSLKDSYEAVGDEYIEAIKDYGYTIWQE